MGGFYRGGVFIALLLLLLLLLLSLSSAEMVINEVMYNSEGNDDTKEYIELYLSEPLNLTYFIIKDASSEDILELVSFVPSSYALIVEEGFNDSSVNLSTVSLYSAGATIGNQLGNTGDTITFTFPNGIVVDTVSYNNSWGGNGDGSSLQRLDGAWQPAAPTPGFRNAAFGNPLITFNYLPMVTITPVLDGMLYTAVSYTKLFALKVDGKDSCSSKDSVTVLYTITNHTGIEKEDDFTVDIGCTKTADTGEFSPRVAGNYTLCGMIINSTLLNATIINSSCQQFQVLDTSTLSCDLSVNITTAEQLMYTVGESIKFKTELNNKTFPFTVDYWIEDLFGNKVKPKETTSNTHQKSWKTAINEEDRVLFIKAKLNSLCHDLNETNNVAEKMFIVKGTPLVFSSVSVPEDSTLAIGDITPNPAVLGKAIKAEITVYKGDTRQYAFTAWVERNGKVLSEKTKFNLKEKFINYSLTLPIPLKSACDLDIENGKAELVVEGLGLRVEEEILLTDGDNDCEKETIVSKTTAEDTAAEEDNSQHFSSDGVYSSPLSRRSSVQEGGIVVYESNASKSRNLIPYFLIVTLGLLSLVLVLKK